MLPIEIHGQLLEKTSLIENINVGEGEVLLLEVRTTCSEGANKSPFALTAAKQAAQTKNALKTNLQSLITKQPESVADEIAHRINLAMTAVCTKQSKMGLVGLQNLGNTCFMNSILQCIANTDKLAKFFLFDAFLFHLNHSNVYGSKGKLAIAFSEFVTDMYVGEASYIAPWDIKRIIAQKAQQFMGYNQHDS